MVESVFTVLVVGLLAGFILSMPIAGPISVMVVYKSLKGYYRYSVRLALGASIIEFLYVFIAVYSITRLYSYYQDYIPYMLLGGSLFLFLIAYKIIRDDKKLTELDPVEDIKTKGGLRTGIFLNLTNPTLLLGWLTSSFIVLSLVSSLGLNTGGLDLYLGNNIDFLHNSGDAANLSHDKNVASNILLALMYALGVSVGCFVWFYMLTAIISKARLKIKLGLVKKAIKFMGLCLLGLGIFLFWKAATLLMS